MIELRRYVEARSWTAVEYVDEGASGTSDRRPALDRLVKDAKRRRFVVLVCWRLDRLGRNLRHLVGLLDDLQLLGVSFVSLAEGIDATTPAGRLQMHLLAAIAEFERARIIERIKAGLERAKRQGKRLGRPRKDCGVVGVPGMTVRQAPALWGCSRSTAARRINEGQLPPRQTLGQSPA